jgi:hypothetical protein
VRNVALRKIVALFCRVIGYTIFETSMDGSDHSCFQRFFPHGLFNFDCLYTADHTVYVNSKSHDSSLYSYYGVEKNKNKNKNYKSSKCYGTKMLMSL